MTGQSPIPAVEAGIVAIVLWGGFYASIGAWELVVGAAVALACCGLVLRVLLRRS